MTKKQRQQKLFNEANVYIQAEDSVSVEFLPSGSIKLTFSNYNDYQTASHKLWLVNFNMTSLPKELTVYIRL